MSRYKAIYTNSLVTDSVAWITISGYFVADSAYQHIVFGIFFDEARTATTESLIVNPNSFVRYHYIDDVFVTPSQDCMTTGFSEPHRDDQVQVFSKPASSVVKILSNEGRRIKNVAIKSMHGNRLLSFELNNLLEYALDLSLLENVVYFLEIDLGDVKVNKRVVIN